MGTPSSPPAVEQLSVDAFLRIVTGSGLLSSDDVQTTMQTVPADRVNDPQFVADHFVKYGKLSRFQSGKLLQGITLGLILGPFHLLAPIGKGGMGAVYLARDSRNHELVAVKVLPPKRARAEERTLARFRREMELGQRVSHPQLTRTLEVGSQGDVHYIVMEYIRGRNLSRVVNDEGALAVPRAARLFSEVALGLEHAHSQGLIHRDLKPSNIMVMLDDSAKVLDLGLALIQGEVGDRTVVGGAGYIVGTLDYIAPEQAEDAVQVDARSDIYSLGCTLYYALAKQPPFPGGTVLQKMLRHRVDEPPPLEQFNPDVPADFLALVRRMMAKRKEERFASAAHLRAALAPWCDRPVLGPPLPNGDEPPATVEMPPVETPGPPSAADSWEEPVPLDEDVPQVVATAEPVEAETEPAAPKKSASGPRKKAAAEAVAEPPAADPAPTAVPVEPAAEEPTPTPVAMLRPGELPFWLDYLLPVGSCVLLLLLAWVLGLTFVLRR